MNGDWPEVKGRRGIQLASAASGMLFESVRAGDAEGLSAELSLQTAILHCRYAGVTDKLYHTGSIEKSLN